MNTIAQQRPMNRLEWSLLGSLSLLWGCSFFLTKVALTGLPPFTLVFLRVSIGALTLGFVLLAMRQPVPLTLTAWTWFLGLGLINNAVPFSLQFWGQVHIASGLAAILNATTPVFTAVVAHFLTQDEKLTANRISGVLLGVCGVASMIGIDAMVNLGADIVPQLAILGGALSYAFAGTLGRRLKGVPPLVFAFGLLTAASIWMLPMMLLTEQPWTLAVPRIEVWGAVLAVAIGGTALAFIIFFRILATAGATNLMLVTLLVPPTALLLGAVLLGERLGIHHFIGLGMIAAGLAVIDGRLLRRIRGT